MKLSFSLFVLFSSTTVECYNTVVTNKSVPGLQNGMDYVKLGSSDLVVSKVCLGTMTFGVQNTLDEGVEQIQRAVNEYGVNMIDTAELYPVPPSADTQGRTDQAIHKYLKASNRDNIVLASKVAGRSEGMKYMPGRNGQGTQVSRQQIIASVDASLQRLGTDYLDLLQIHWPDRYTGSLFGQADFTISKYEDASMPNSFLEQLETMGELVDQGKIRYVGVSNETPYGICKFSELALQSQSLPSIVSIQNSYSLVVRKDYEAGIAEACYHYNIGLLPYSPLAGGTLTGKYRNGPVKGARLSVFPGYMERYLDSQNEKAVAAYCKIAEDNGMSPTQLSLSWCYHNPLVASTIIGATSIAQLDENIKAYDIKLSKDVQKAIDKVYQQYTDPTKAR